MAPTIYSIIHVVGVILLTAYTFQAFVAPLPHRARILRLTGILSLVVLFTGIGLFLYGDLDDEMPIWLIFKLACWLWLSGLAGMAFRRPEKAQSFALISVVLIALAVFAVYQKPFS
jgi:hypothetical protein